MLAQLVTDVRCSTLLLNRQVLSSHLNVSATKQVLSKPTISKVFKPINISCASRPCSFRNDSQARYVRSTVVSCFSNQIARASVCANDEAEGMVSKIQQHGDKVAVVSNSKEYTYSAILAHAVKLKEKLAQLQSSDSADKDSGDPLIGPRIAIMAPPGPEYVAATWATWLFGGVAVPLAIANPANELEYVLQDAKVSAVLSTEKFTETMSPLCEANHVALVPLDAVSTEVPEEVPVQQSPPLDSGALIIYTSGTTGKPKGVIHLHKGIQAQVSGLVSAWEWAPSDRILHALPLHHIHGIVNALYCAHATGACVEFLPSFQPGTIWTRFQAQPAITVFMGVPTMYALLLKKYEAFKGDKKQAAAAAAGGLRLTISGSAACPIPIMSSWQQVTGQRLLERYGMTEIGMALSNPYSPMEARTPGCVGLPLPGVEVKLVPPVDEDESTPSDGQEPFEGPGEIRIRGDTVFKLYFGRPEATVEAFDEDGFFCTGDTGALENGMYKILGRTSVDIIKMGGYKLSALEIENHLLENAAIKECAVCGLPDDTYGEQVAVVIVYNEGQALSDSELKEWSRDHMAQYKVPKVIKVLDAIPRNAMGKVNKKQLVSVFDE